jgi:hypothetical protein
VRLLAEAARERLEVAGHGVPKEPGVHGLAGHRQVLYTSILTLPAGSPTMAV